MKTDAVAEVLAERLSQAVVGGIVSRGAHVERTTNYAGEDVYLVEMDVDDPDGPTWSVDDLTNLDLLANRIAAEAGASEYVYVQLTAARDRADDDEDPSSELA